MKRINLCKISGKTRCSTNGGVFSGQTGVLAWWVNKDWKGRNTPNLLFSTQNISSPFSPRGRERPQAGGGKDPDVALCQVVN